MYELKTCTHIEMSSLKNEFAENTTLGKDAVGWRAFATFCFGFLKRNISNEANANLDD